MDENYDLFSQDEAARRRAQQYAEDLVTRCSAIEGSGVPTPAIAVDSVGIVGAGMMGAAIAAVHLKQNRRVTLYDQAAEALATCRERIAEELTEGLSRDEAHRRAEQLVELTANVARVARCDLVIESIVEKLEVKRQLFAALKPHCTDRTILASNTSTIPITRLAETLDNPERFCGLHFFHPVRRRPLVEIIRGERTSADTLAAVESHARTIDKVPIVVADGPGFLVNRLLFPYLGEALELLLEGASVEQIEQAATAFGMAKGPLALLDEIGLDTTLQGGWVLWEAFPERIVASPLLVTMVKQKRLGQKVGRGFFLYDDINEAGSGKRKAEQGRGKPQAEGEQGKAEADRGFPFSAFRFVQGRPDPEVNELIGRWAKPPQDHTPQGIIERLLLPMVVEASRILEEGQVTDPGEIDLAVLYGLGFPKDRGGLLWWADEMTPTEILRRLAALGDLGARVQPTRLLRELVVRPL